MIKFTKQQKLDFFHALFITCLLLANFIGLKAAELNGFAFSVAVFTYPLTFVIIDSIGKVYGKQASQHLINLGLFMLIITAILTFVSLELPAAARFTQEEAYQSIFGIAFRVLIASLIAYYFSHILDIYVFHKVDSLLKSKRIWLSSAASNVVGELLDTVLFMFLAFYGVYQDSLLVSITISWWLLKVVVNFIHTPLVYWGINWLSKE